ncbi:Oidioi.mRNA.OKI2018_I69.chr1.g3248.t1.cds [Oikopleura dioica]|uniref:Oidioi.mRNA.OKI2018_I69.chr1.g3248.t1.cds n=1 Tax=Oikopleura dioica TaxID=34765 RepID=A0ABN7SZ01_OIKDI|nr:Oidioi.mRNA.OKI2018_I69.chr1.g3248.t1.cds [Oikopleura dioica]
MKLTITGPGDSIWSQDLSPDLDIATLKMLSALDLNLDFNNMVFIANGQPLLDDSMKIEATGLKDGDMIMAMPGNFLNRASQTDLRQSNPRGRQQAPDWNAKAQEVLEQFRSQLGRLQNWPALQEAVRAGNLQEIARVLREDYEKKVAQEERLRRAEANPMDPENQRILEEHIRQQNIDESLNTGPVYATFLKVHPTVCFY